MRFILPIIFLFFGFNAFSQVDLEKQTNAKNYLSFYSSIATIADTSNIKNGIWDRATVFVEDSEKVFVYNGTGFIEIQQGVQSTPDTSALLVYAPAHGLADSITLYGYVPVKTNYTRATADALSNVHFAYAVDSPHPDTLELKVAGYLNLGLNHGLALAKQYFLQDDGTQDTIVGTVRAPTVVVLSATEVILLEVGADEDQVIARVPIISPTITAVGGNPIIPTDSIIQVVIETIYKPAGLAKPGTIFFTTFPTQSSNLTYRESTNNPLTPSYSWLWDGKTATRINTLITSIDLESTTSGGVTLTPVTVTPPNDSIVAEWLQTNYEDNNLRLYNGSILYYEGTGTAQSPQRQWMVIDDLSNSGEVNNYKRIIKNISSDAGRPLPLADLAQDGALTGQVVGWNGSAWTPQSTLSVLDTIINISVCNDTCDFKSLNQALTFASFNRLVSFDSSVSARGIVINITRNGDGTPTVLKETITMLGGNYSNVTITTADSVIVERPDGATINNFFFESRITSHPFFSNCNFYMNGPPMRGLLIVNAFPSRANNLTIGGFNGSRHIYLAYSGIDWTNIRISDYDDGGSNGTRAFYFQGVSGAISISMDSISAFSAIEAQWSDISIVLNSFVNVGRDSLTQNMRFLSSRIHLVNNSPNQGEARFALLGSIVNCPEGNAQYKPMQSNSLPIPFNVTTKNGLALRNVLPYPFEPLATPPDPASGINYYTDTSTGANISKISQGSAWVDVGLPSILPRQSVAINADTSDLTIITDTGIITLGDSSGTYTLAQLASKSVPADSVTIKDTTNNFSSSNVEGALAELATEITEADGNGIYSGSGSLPDSLTKVTNTAGLRFQKSDSYYLHIQTDYDDPFVSPYFPDNNLMLGLSVYDIEYEGFSLNLGIDSTNGPSIISTEFMIQSEEGKKFRFDSDGINLTGWDEDQFGEGGDYSDFDDNSLAPIGLVKSLVADSLELFEGTTDLESTQDNFQHKGIRIVDEFSDTEQFVGVSLGGDVPRMHFFRPGFYQSQITIQSLGVTGTVKDLQNGGSSSFGLRKDEFNFNSNTSSKGITYTGFGENSQSFLGGDYSTLQPNSLVPLALVDAKIDSIIIPVDTLILSYDILQYNATDTIADGLGFQVPLGIVTQAVNNRRIIAVDITTADTVSTDLYIQMYHEHTSTGASNNFHTGNLIVPAGTNSVRYTTADTEIPNNGFTLPLNHYIFGSVVNGSAVGSTSYLATEGANGITITYYLIE